LLTVEVITEAGRHRPPVIVEPEVGRQARLQLADSHRRQMLNRVSSGLTSARLASTEEGNAYLQPFDFHVQSADPLVEFGLDGLIVAVVTAAAVAERGLDAVEELLLPLADPDGMDLR